MTQLYLASASPRRRELLTQLDIPFSVLNVAVEEQRLPEEAAEVYVRRLAHDVRDREPVGPRDRHVHARHQRKVE